jgi:hypothetical protein
MAYDPLHDIMLYLIGMSSPETWTFDCAGRQWQQAAPAASPAIMGRLTFNRALNMFMLLGGEGLFLASLTGPGNVVLQSMNLKQLALALSPYMVRGQ